MLESHLRNVNGERHRIQTPWQIKICNKDAGTIQHRSCGCCNCFTRYVQEDWVEVSAKLSKRLNEAVIARS